MFDLCHIDLDVSLVRADPLDPDDALLEVDRHDEAVIIAFNALPSSWKRQEIDQASSPKWRFAPAVFRSSRHRSGLHIQLHGTDRSSPAQNASTSFF